MPKEETIEIRHVRGTVGEKNDMPEIGHNTTLSSRVSSQIIRSYGSPDLIHEQGAYEIDDTITLDAGEDNIIPLISDGTYLYGGTQTSPGKIVRIDLATFTKESTLTLDAGENLVHSLIIHKDYLYAGLGTSPSKIVKINRLSFAKESTLTLDAGENNLYDLAVDGHSIYAAIHTSPGKVVKVSIDTFTKTSVLTFGAGENLSNYMCITRGYLYVPLETSPGIVKQVDLSTFTESRSLTLNAGENKPFYIGTDGIYLYAALDVSPGVVVKIAFHPETGVLSRVGALTFPAGSDRARSVCFNGMNIAVGLMTVPARIVFIDQAAFMRTYTFTFAAGLDKLHYMYTDGAYIYAPHYMTPSKISRLYILPSHDIFQRAAALLLEQVHSGRYNVYPTLSTGPLITSNVAAWTKGNYAEIIPASTITTTFYITGVVLFGLTANTEYEVDMAIGVAASESVIATVFHQTDNANLAHECLFPAPIKVGSGTRISARCADSTGGLTCRAKVRYKV